jgi:hypothetical protein
MCLHAQTCFMHFKALLDIYIYTVFSVFWDKLYFFHSRMFLIYDYVFLKVYIFVFKSLLVFYDWGYELFIYVFIYSYVHTLFGPFIPFPHHLTSRQNLFCPLLQFCWREDISNNKKDIAFLLVCNFVAHSYNHSFHFFEGMFIYFTIIRVHFL